MEAINPQVQGLNKLQTQQFKRKTRHIITKLLKGSAQDKNLKKWPGNKKYYIEMREISMTADFLSETM